MNLNQAEKQAFETFEANTELHDLDLNHDNLIKLGINVAASMAKLIEGYRARQEIKIIMKADGTRVCPGDHEAEDLARKLIHQAFPDHTIVGEEKGGEFDLNKYCWGIDPIDSTNNFLGNGHTPSINLTLFHRGEPLFSLICAPFSGGTIFYAYGEESPRIVWNQAFSRNIVGHDLPLNTFAEQTPPPLLLNIHPHPRSLDLRERAFEQRKGRQLNNLTSIGGSPALHIASTTSQRTAFQMGWHGAATEPWDLSSGIHIVRNAGGRVTNENGVDLPWIGYEGIVAASVNNDIHERVLALLR